MTQEKYRAYFFQNMYLPGIHAGVQSQHTTARMFVKYIHNSTDYVEYVDARIPKCFDVLMKWATEDETTIVLKGGMQGDLEQLIELFKSQENPYPWAFFKESDYALGGALTNVGIILPERIYTYDQLVRKAKNTEQETGGWSWENVPKLSEYEMQIVEALRGKQLMN